MKEGELPKIGSYVNILGTAFLTIKGNCTVCAAKGDLKLCNKLPTCYDTIAKKSVIAFSKVAAR